MVGSLVFERGVSLDMLPDRERKSSPRWILVRSSIGRIFESNLEVCCSINSARKRRVVVIAFQFLKQCRRLKGMKSLR